MNGDLIAKKIGHCPTSKRVADGGSSFFYLENQQAFFPGMPVFLYNARRGKYIAGHALLLKKTVKNDHMITFFMYKTGVMLIISRLCKKTYHLRTFSLSLANFRYNAIKKTNVL